jgi:hypothetical protein
MKTSEKKKIVIKNSLSTHEMESIESDFIENKDKKVFNINQILEMQKAKQLQTV